MKKPVILFLGLLLPICIFIFLKMFGRNEFDVPLLYDTEVTAPVGCEYSYTSPYVLSDTISLPSFDKLLLIDFGSSDYRLQQVLDAHRDIKSVQGNQLKFSESEAATLKKCAFLLTGLEDVVLIDASRRIRGKYVSRVREDMDRLGAELVILQGKY